MFYWFSVLTTAFIDLEKKRIVTEQATLPIGGTPELRWGNLKGMSAWMRE
jgi:hypothetical protein